MIRATVQVGQIDELEKGFRAIKTMKGVNIVKIGNNLVGNEQNVVINFIYFDYIIGEV